MVLGRADLSAAFLLCAVAASGCGLLSNGTHSEVPVRSEPAGAQVWVDGVLVGHTPLRLRLPSRRSHLVEVRAEGYAAERYVLEPRVEAAYVILDIAFTAVVGIVVDAATRAWLRLRPYEITARLEASPAGASGAVAGARARGTDPPADGDAHTPTPHDTTGPEPGPPRPVEIGDGLAAPRPG